MYALAQALRRRSRATPYDYVQRVQRARPEQRDATPRRRRRRAVAARRTSCSATGWATASSSRGAMALLLRMGGVPARVAVGLRARAASTASASEYVVRDVDAHSWVEAYFPRHRLGHRSTRRRPRRPRARRSRTGAERGDAARAAAERRPGRAGDRRPAPRRPAARGRRRRAARLVARRCSASSLALLRRRRACCVVGAARRARRPRRRARTSPSSQRALRRIGPHAGRRRMTLARARARARRQRRRARGYLRAVRARRYGAAPRRRPTPRAAPRRCAASSARGPRASAGGCARGGRCRRVIGRRGPYTARAWPSVYELFRNGTRLLEQGDFHAAAVPLSARPRPRARQGLDPRGARPRAVRRAALRARPPTSSRRSSSTRRPNDYALFCLGRSLQQLGRHAEARHPLALAATCGPSARDYRRYRDRARRRAALARRR